MRTLFQELILTSMLSVCSAQTAPPPFEVTAIRPNRSGELQGAVFFQPGRFMAKNATVKMLIPTPTLSRTFKFPAVQAGLIPSGSTLRLKRMSRFLCAAKSFRGSNIGSNWG